MSAITLTCRTCMLDFECPAGANLALCPACGTPHARPRAEGEALEKLSRAARLRHAGEFAEAEACYRHVLVDYDDEHEALWGRLMCQYGVESVTDPLTGRRHPTVHIPRRKPLSLQADFRHACELAPQEVRAQYEAEAEYIDGVLGEIHRLAGSQPPCDIFICHKTTCLEGPGYTEDYNRGVQLYMKLHAAGWRVFFAPFAGLTPGESYEAGIYHALSTARVMLLISSDPAFLTSAWVKSEWSRYLEMLDDGADKHLIPLMYDGLADARMPREIRARRLQHIRMGELDAAEKLMQTLQKRLGGVNPAPAAPAAAPVAAPVTPPVAAPAAPSAAAPAPARRAPVSSAEYRTEQMEGGVRITAYTGRAEHLVIPDALEGMPVKSIWHRAFEGNRLKSVTLPLWLEELSSSAFLGCDALEEICLPEGGSGFLEVKEQALYVNRTTLFRVPPGLKMDRFFVPQGTREIMTAAFHGCAGIRSVHLPEGLEVIGKVAFMNCAGLQSVSLPGTLRKIHTGAFGGCTSLQTLRIPEGVAEIGEGAFDDCPRLTLVVTANSPAHRYAADNGLRFRLADAGGNGPAAGMSAPAAPAQDETPASLFATEPVKGGLRITAYTGRAAEVVIPDVIGGQPVVSIAHKAFGDHEELQAVTLPRQLGEMSSIAFLGCFSLAEFRVKPGHGGVFSLREKALFLDGRALFCYPPGRRESRYAVPEGTRELISSAFFGCRSLTALRLPQGLAAIGAAAFCGCKALTALEIPDSVKEIGDAAFDGCTSLGAVKLPSGPLTFGADVFINCPQLVLEVKAGSPAHRYARENGLSFRVQKGAGGAPDGPAAPAAQKAPAPAAPARPAFATLLIKRTSRHEGSLGKIAVRIDGEQALLIKNGGSTVLQLAPGRHTIDVKFQKLLFVETKWTTRYCARDVLPQELLPGQSYTIDVADYLHQINP